MNQKMQTLYLVAVISSVETFLENTGSRCIHLKYFGLPYGLIAFKHNHALDKASTTPNNVMTNPEVHEVSSTLRQVENVHGEMEYINLMSFLITNYRNTELETR